MSTEGERCTGAQSFVVVPVLRGYGADLVGVDLPVDRGLREGEHGLERGEGEDESEDANVDRVGCVEDAISVEIVERRRDCLGWGVRHDGGCQE